MLEPPPTSDYIDMNNGVSKSTLLEPTIKHLMKETSLDCEGKTIVRSNTSILTRIKVKK